MELGKLPALLICQIPARLPKKSPNHQLIFQVQDRFLGWLRTGELKKIIRMPKRLTLKIYPAPSSWMKISLIANSN